MNNYNIETDDQGNKFYYLNSKFHRECGPAVERVNGDKVWYKNGECHRDDGPAIEYATGKKFWFLNDKCYGYDDDYTNESWKRFIKTLVFL